MRTVCATFIALAVATSTYADTLTCDMSAYKPATGLSASIADNVLTIVLDSERGEQLRVRFAIDSGTPTIRELAVRGKNGTWNVVGSNLTPEYRIVSGYRRMTNQQMSPLRGLKVPLTSEVVDKYKWDAFWDAPLDFSPPAPRGGGRGGAEAPGRAGPAGAPAAGGAPPRWCAAVGGAAAAGGAPVPPRPPDGGNVGGGNPPPAQGVAHQPGLPRKPEEVRRARAEYHATGCTVTTNGARVEVTFPGVQIGTLFSGRLQYTLYKGSSLIKQEVIARTDEPALAYKYDTGLRGFAIQPSSRVMWRDLSNAWQDYSFGGAKNDNEVPIKTANRTDRCGVPRRRDCRLSTATQLLLGERDFNQSRLQLVSKGQ